MFLCNLCQWDMWWGRERKTRSWEKWVEKEMWEAVLKVRERAFRKACRVYASGFCTMLFLHQEKVNPFLENKIKPGPFTHLYFKRSYSTSVRRCANTPTFWLNSKSNSFYSTYLNPLLFNWRKSYFTPLPYKLIKHVWSCLHYHTMWYNVILRFLNVHKTLYIPQKRLFNFWLLAYFPAVTL